MALEDLKRYIPESDSPIHAFEVAYKNNSTIVNNPESIYDAPRQKTIKAVTDYVYGGYGFLAENGYDDYLKEIGSVSLAWLYEGDVDAWVSSDPAETARRIGMTDQTIEQIQEQSTIPFVSIELNKDSEESRVTAEKLQIIIPTDFIFQAQIDPIQGLGSLVNRGSIIRDFANGVHLMGSIRDMGIRASAMEAHFIQQVASRYPALELSPESQEILKAYPSELPDYLKYKGNLRKGVYSSVPHNNYAHSNN